MGILRLYLAIAVVAGHSSAILGIPLVPGRTAVECFFAISGFYMSMVLEQKYLRLPSRRWRTFMASRLMRLYPVYILILALSVLFVIPGGQLFLGSTPQHVNSLLALQPMSSIPIMISNLILFTQDWSLFTAVDPQGSLYLSATSLQQHEPAYLYYFVPQAWSIGVELTFYVLAPILLRLRTSKLFLIAICSVALRGVFWLGSLRSDPWSYRFFPFELSIFLAGAIAYRERGRLGALGRRWRFTPLIATLVLLGVLPLASRAPSFNNYLLIAIPFVISIAIPGIFSSTQHSRLDRWIGELSYPLYLVHVLVIGMLARVGFGGDGRAVPGIVAVPVAVVAAIAVVQAADRPLEALRQRRIKRALQRAGLGSVAQDSGIAPLSNP